MRTTYVKSSSSVFSCSICDNYNRVHRDQNKCPIFKSYNHGVDSWIGDKRCYNSDFNENIVNELHELIEIITPI